MGENLPTQQGAFMDKQKQERISPELKSKYARIMAENLPMLRARLNLTQTELGELIGVTRQTINSIESGSREISWGNFLSLLFLFTQNKSTQVLLPILGIYTPELACLFNVTDLRKLK